MRRGEESGGGAERGGVEEERKRRMRRETHFSHIASRCIPADRSTRCSSCTDRRSYRVDCRQLDEVNQTFGEHSLIYEKLHESWICSELVGLPF